MGHRVHVLAAWLACAAGGAASVRAQSDGGPAYDLCANAVELNCIPEGSGLILSNFSTSSSPDDPSFSCRAPDPGPGALTIWARFVATGTAAEVSLCSPATSLNNTLLGVYTGQCGSLAEFACNDDAGCGPLGRQSSLTLSGLTPGMTYYIQMASHNVGDLGQIVLTLVCTDAPDCNKNGTPDAQDIAGGASLDCFDAAAKPGAAGGADGVPDECQCVSDWDRNGTVNSTDVSEFINTFFADQAGGTFDGDINCNGVSNSTDVSDFINLWFSAQAGQLPFSGCQI